MTSNISEHHVTEVQVQINVCLYVHSSASRQIIIIIMSQLFKYRECDAVWGKIAGMFTCQLSQFMSVLSACLLSATIAVQNFHPYATFFVRTIPA